MKIIAISRPDSHTNESSSDSIVTPSSDVEVRADSHDRFNRPRLRRDLILSSLSSLYPDLVAFQSPPVPHENLNIFKLIHGEDLVDFLYSAWHRWVDLGENGRDPSAFHHTFQKETGKMIDSSNMNKAENEVYCIPPLVPIHCILQRDPYQIPSTNLIGQMGYYCTDMVTPIVPTLLEELKWDAAVVDSAVYQALAKSDPSTVDTSSASTISSHSVVYAITTHPGHHSAYDVFGGYCYLNNAALAAKLFQMRSSNHNIIHKVAVLDVDYHCGNGTASIFYDNPSVLVVSLHCDPEYDYPFNSGFADQTGIGAGVGTTLHIPLPPGTTWKHKYEKELTRAMDAIVAFGAQALVVSLGLDTHDGDPVAIRRAGFHLAGEDYWEMGYVIGSKLQGKIPILFLQEGGYKMDVVGEAAARVVGGCAQAVP